MTDIAKLRKELGEIINKILERANDLRTTNPDLKAIMDKFSEMESYYESKIKKLEKELNSEKIYNTTLEEQNSYLNESNAHLGEDYAVSEANNTDLKKENQNLDALNKLLQEENTRLQNLCTVCVKLNGLEIKNQQLKKKNQELKLELKVAYEDDFKKTKNIYTKQEIDQIEKLQKENERLTEYIKSYSLAATTDIDKYKKDLDLANKRLDNLIRIEKENESLKEQLKKNKYTSSPYSLPPLTPPHHY